MNKILFDNSYEGQNFKGRKLNFEELKQSLKVIVEIEDEIYTGTIKQISLENDIVNLLLTDTGETIKLKDTNNIWVWDENTDKNMELNNEKTESTDDKLEDENELKLKSQSKPLQEKEVSKKSAFPDWDILPLSDIINPRIKSNLSK